MDIIQLVDKIATQKLSARTLGQYQRDFASLEEMGLTPVQRAEVARLEGKPLSSSRFYALKASYQWGLVQKYLKLSEAIQQEDDFIDKDCYRWQQQHYLGLLEASKPDPDKKRCRDQQVISMAPDSLSIQDIESAKKHLAQLSKNYPDFRELVASNIDIRFRDDLAILQAGGCRPSELKKGIELIVEKDILIIAVNGSKTGEADEIGITPYGQEWRELELVPVRPCEYYLHSLALMHGGHYRHKLSHSLRTLRDAHKQAVGKSLGSGWVEKLPLYLYRHAVSADLKKKGLDEVTIAKVLGHSALESQHHYGKARQGQGGGGIVNAVAEKTPTGTRAYHKLVQGESMGEDNTNELQSDPPDERLIPR